MCSIIFEFTLFVVYLCYKIYCKRQSEFSLKKAEFTEFSALRLSVSLNLVRSVKLVELYHKSKNNNLHNSTRGTVNFQERWRMQCLAAEDGPHARPCFYPEGYGPSGTGTFSRADHTRLRHPFRVHFHPIACPVNPSRGDRSGPFLQSRSQMQGNTVCTWWIRSSCEIFAKFIQFHV